MAAITATSSTTLGALTVSAEATIAARPGTTLAALQSGSATLKWVAAIGGYPYLLTDAPSGCAVSAWDGLDWTSDLQGLYVDLQNEQSINPWDPFTRGGKLTLRIAPDAADTFGIDTHRKTAGAESLQNDTTLDEDDTTVTVQSASAFSASGTAYIGTEAIGYSGKTATELTGCTRGKYAPFTVDGGTTSRFGQRHELVTDPNAIRLFPIVSQQPRAWHGRWVGLWWHRWDEQNQLLNTRANAQLTYAGRIVEIADDPSSGCTVVECEHVLDYIKRAVVGADMWSAKLADGMYLDAEMYFSLSEAVGAGPFTNETDPLTVVPSGASGANEINSGFYSNEEIQTKVNAWLASELAAARIDGVYTVKSAPYDLAGYKLRTYFSFNIPGTVSVGCRFYLPGKVNKFWGRLASSQSTTGPVWFEDFSADSTLTDVVGQAEPLRIMVDFDDQQANAHQARFQISDERGTFVDQTGDLPGYQAASGFEQALVLVGDRTAYVSKAVGDDVLRNIDEPPIHIAGTTPIDWGYLGAIEIPLEAEPPTVKQILYYQDTFANLIKKLFYTTSGAGYNHATYDALPKQLGIGIPGELLGDDFEASIDALPGAELPYTLIIDEPIKLSDLLTGSLVFRWSFLRWVDEHLEFCLWQTPTTGAALTESNKAAPVGTQDEHRTASTTTTDWQRQIIKVDYDRDIANVDLKGGYRSSLTLVDRTAIDDAGRDTKSITIQLREAYGASYIDSLKGNFKSQATLFTRPVRRQTRTIDSRFFEGYAVGDCVLVTDEFARDPDTGQRGVATRPGIITRHTWSPGGAGPNGSVGDIHGEVDVMFLDLLRVAQYVPTAQLDDTATNSGYVVATKIATCYAHKFSETSEAADASYFTAGRAIRFIEIDPSDPASASTHDDIVASQTGNTITLTTGFAAFDNAKRYKVVFDVYGDSIAAQQAGFVYQADDSDGMIADTRAPFQYAVGVPFYGTANDASDPVELPASNTYGDGIGRDVGTDKFVNHLINNLADFKCAMSLPLIQGTEIQGTNGVSFALVEVRPIWLSAETMSSTPVRYLSVAPYFKSVLGSSSVRISLVRYRPSDDTLNDAELGSVISQVTFSTSSSTYAIATAQSLSIAGIKSQSGRAYLLVELTPNARYKGLAVCQETARS